MGWPRKNSGYVLRTPELEALVCSDYHPGGKTIREIVRDRKLSISVVHGILSRHNVRRRPVGNHSKLKLRRGPAYDSEVLARFRANEPLVEIARKMRTSRRLVSAVVREYGVTRSALVRKSPSQALHAEGAEPR